MGGRVGERAGAGPNQTVRRGLLLLASGAALFVSGPAQAEPRATFEAASEAAFSRPHDIVLSPDGRFLYVSDLGHDRVAVLDPDSLALLGSFGDDQLDAPHDVAFDRDGRLLVADTGNDRVAIYAVDGPQGNLVASLSDGLSAPEGVAQGPDGRIYVANARGDDVVVFQGDQAVAQGDGGLDLQRPHDIALAVDGTVYLADPGSNRIRLLGPDLAFRRDLGADLDLNEPKYFDLDPEGWLFIADEYNHVIKILDPAERLVLVIGQGRAGEGPDLFNYPEGAETRGDRLWVADTRNHRIVRYRLEGLR
ncbi:MAG: NHL repeat-containing protein [Pseudomonadota bacterium]